MYTVKDLEIGATRTLLRARYTSDEVRFHFSFGGKKKFKKAERQYTVFEHSNIPALLEAGVD